MNTVIIVGSSRYNGNTAALASMLTDHVDWDIINLKEYDIGHFDYANKNSGDDFISLMEHIIEKYDMVVFATPVYWYAMSGILKVFIDRITDLLSFNKELGTKLRHKKMAVVSSSIGNHLGELFWLPFMETARYLGMEYQGHLHTISGKVDPQELKRFIQQLYSNME